MGAAVSILNGKSTANSLINDDDDDHSEGERKEQKRLPPVGHPDPVQLFRKYDDIGNDFIDFYQFYLLLNDMQFGFSQTSAEKYFKIIDKTGFGRLTQEEFTTALFTKQIKKEKEVVLFTPAKLLDPKILFRFFDEDQSDAIDSFEYTALLRFMNGDIPLLKQEDLFNEYEDSNTETIEYDQFRTLWTELCDVKYELNRRGILYAKDVSLLKLAKRLESIVLGDESAADELLEQVEFWKQWEKQRLLRQAVVKNAVELANKVLAQALDAAGQVYMFGTGPAYRFDGKASEVNHMNAPHFERIKSLWRNRITPQDSEKVSPFRTIIVSMATVHLWGKSIAQVECGGSVIFARSDAGQLFCWGGSARRWKYIFDPEEGVMGDEHPNDPRDMDVVQTTARSRLVKCAMPNAILADRQKVIDDPFYLKYAIEPIKPKYLTQEEIKKGMTFLGQYYDVASVADLKSDSEIPDNIIEIVRPELDFRLLKFSLEIRGIKTSNKPYLIVELEMMEYIMLEMDCMGVPFHLSMKKMDLQCRHLKSQHQNMELEKLIRQAKRRWSDLRILSNRITAADLVEYASSRTTWTIARDAMFNENLRRTNKAMNAFSNQSEIQVSGITTRGPQMKILNGNGVLHISAGSRHAVAIGENGKLYSWGVATFGRLGSSIERKQADCSKPTLMKTVSNMRFRLVSAGYSHTAASTWDGKLFIWGSAATGKLGLVVPTEFECYVVAPSLVVLPGMSRGCNIRSISCGAGHTAAVTDTGQLFIWGCGDGGRLGLESGTVALTRPKHSPAITVGTVYEPRLVKALEDHVIVSVSCGVCHTAVVTEIRQDPFTNALSGGDVYVAGSAFALGTYTPLFTLLEKLRGRFISQVSCGNAHTACVTSSGELYTFGNNTGGCTGHNTLFQSITTPTLVPSMYYEQKNVSLGKPTFQSSIHPDVTLGEVKTKVDENPYYMIDLQQMHHIEKIILTNVGEWVGKLYLFVSLSPIEVDTGAAMFRKCISTCVYTSVSTRHKSGRIQWTLPPRTQARFALVQLSQFGILSFQGIEILGENVDKYLGPKVHSVNCGDMVTVAICRPLLDKQALENHYIQAVKADSASRIVLRTLPVYRDVYLKYESLPLPTKCGLCNDIETCALCILMDAIPSSNKKTDNGMKSELSEICELYLEIDQQNYKGEFDSSEEYIDAEFEETKKTDATESTLKSFFIKKKVEESITLPGEFKLKVAAAFGAQSMIGTLKRKKWTVENSNSAKLLENI